MKVLGYVRGCRLRPPDGSVVLRIGRERLVCRGEMQWDWVECFHRCGQGGNGYGWGHKTSFQIITNSITNSINVDHTSPIKLSLPNTFNNTKKMPLLLEDSKMQLRFRFLGRYKKFIMQTISKHQPTSKHPLDASLPKISQGNNQSSHSYQLKYEWVNRSSEYLLLPTNDIHQEHNYLREELGSLIEELKRHKESKRFSEGGSRVSTKPLNRSNQINQAQNRQRQIENNHLIVARLRNELQLLQRQANPHSPEGLSSKVQQIKQKITKAKQKIKDVKHRSKQIGDVLDSGHDYFQEMKKLQHQRDGFLSRKNKLEQKVYQSEHNLQRVIENLSQIEGDALYAQTYLEDWHENDKTEKAQRNLQGEYKQKIYQLQIGHKTMDSQKNTKTQKYHHLLKTLQTSITKQELLDNSIQKSQLKNLYQKKQLMELQQQMTQLNLSNCRSRTSGSLDPHDRILLPVIRQRPSHLPIRKHLSTSRTKTTTQANGPKANYTEILTKPPSSESDITSMVSQPSSIGYFRSSRKRLGNDRHTKTAVGTQQSYQLVHVPLQQEIIEQSPEKETIDKNGSEVRVKKENVDKSEQEEQRNRKQQIEGNQGVLSEPIPIVLQNKRQVQEEKQSIDGLMTQEKVIQNSQTIEKIRKEIQLKTTLRRWRPSLMNNNNIDQHRQT